MFRLYAKQSSSFCFVSFGLGQMFHEIYNSLKLFLFDPQKFNLILKIWRKKCLANASSRTFGQKGSNWHMKQGLTGSWYIVISWQEKETCQEFRWSQDIQQNIQKFWNSPILTIYHNKIFLWNNCLVSLLEVLTLGNQRTKRQSPLGLKVFWKVNLL